MSSSLKIFLKTILAHLIMALSKEFLGSMIGILKHPVILRKDDYRSTITIIGRQFSNKG